MRKIIVALFWFMPTFVNAQNINEIRFSTVKVWQEALNEAKAKNKPILIDAYATWCVPCKKMEKEVFTEKSVADFVNENFIPLRVQMDQPKADASEFVKNWFLEAERWKNYVTAYPCFLFFTPDGQFSGAEQGAYNAEDFLALLKKNMDPQNNYLARIKNFREGKLDKKQLLLLAYFSRDIKDTIAGTVAREYKRLYVDPLSIDSLLNPEFGNFSADFFRIFSTKDPIIKYINEHPELTDSLVHKEGYARKLSDYLIMRDYINNQIVPNGVAIATTPEWDNLKKKISEDFDSETAERIVLNSKISWARRHRRFEDAAKYEFQKIDKYGMDTTATGRGFFNNMVYSDIFPNVDDTSLLRKAISLMRYVNQLENHQNSAYIDTYAALLYKAGKRNEALKVENTALKLAKKSKNQNEVQVYTDMIERMKRGEEIWKDLK